jgi:hypothetical protein
VFLDADDLFLPEYLEEMRTLSRAHPGSGLFFTDAWVFDDERRWVARRTAMESLDPPRHPMAADDLFDGLLERNFVFVAATVRREPLLRAGPFSTALGAEDWEMWLRLAALGTAAVPTSRPLALYRRSRGQVSADPRRMLNAVHEALEIVERNYELSPARRARVAERRREIDGLRMAAGDERPADRRRLASVRRLAGRWRHWRVRPPRAIREAFPDLKAL